MSLADTLQTRDIWVRHTSTTGSSHVQHHRVWDAQRFIDARAKDAAEVNAKQKDGEPRLARVEQITEEQFKKERA